MIIYPKIFVSLFGFLKHIYDGFLKGETRDHHADKLTLTISYTVLL